MPIKFSSEIILLVTRFSKYAGDSVQVSMIPPEEDALRLFIAGAKRRKKSTTAFSEYFS